MQKQNTFIHLYTPNKAYLLAWMKFVNWCNLVLTFYIQTKTRLYIRQNPFWTETRKEDERINEFVIEIAADSGSKLCRSAQCRDGLCRGLRAVARWRHSASRCEWKRSSCLASKSTCSTPSCHSKPSSVPHHSSSVVEPYHQSCS